MDKHTIWRLAIILIILALIVTAIILSVKACQTQPTKEPLPIPEKTTRPVITAPAPSTTVIETEEPTTETIPLETPKLVASEPPQTEWPVVTEIPLTLENMRLKYDMDDDAIMLAKLLYREAGVVKSKTEQACVVWTVLNRVDKNKSSVAYEVTKPHQYAWYEDTLVYDELLELAYDVLSRWYYEKETGESNGRVLPADYFFFYGDGRHNHFFQVWGQKDVTWDYSLPSPYMD